MKSPQEIVDQMLEKDAFSKWMQVEIIELSHGYCKLKGKVKPEMLNGFEITHGGISYSLADSALAFAANSRGQKCVSIETSISHVQPSKKGDVIIAEAKEVHRGKRTGIYSVVVSTNEKAIAYFKGTVHVKAEEW